MKTLKYILIYIVALPCFASNNEHKSVTIEKKKDSFASCMMVPSQFPNASSNTVLKFNGDTSATGMIFIKGGNFMMGGDKNLQQKL